MLFVEREDIFEMFEHTTQSEKISYELSEGTPEEFFPMDGLLDEQESSYILFKV